MFFYQFFLTFDAVVVLIQGVAIIAFITPSILYAEILALIGDLGADMEIIEVVAEGTFCALSIPKLITVGIR